jgi:AcrR family transcriptional regulator
MPAATLKTFRTREREARRDLILSSARRLFSEKDFRSVTVREIARAAGVSPGTIYRHYEHLDELFLEVFFLGTGELIRRIDVKCSGGGACTLAKFCETYIDYLNENMTFYQMMGHFMLGGRLSEDATGRLNPIMRALMDRVEGVVRRSGVRGQSRLAAHALFSSLNGIMISYARYPGRSLEEIRRHTMRLSRVVARFFERKAGPSIE